jgi:hypothetical protein
LNLVDEVNIDEFVKEASIALEDEDQLRQFIKEKAAIAIERFLVSVQKTRPCNAFKPETEFSPLTSVGYCRPRIIYQKCQFQWRRETLQMDGR